MVRLPVSNAKLELLEIRILVPLMTTRTEWICFCQKASLHINPYTALLSILMKDSGRLSSHGSKCFNNVTGQKWQKLVFQASLQHCCTLYFNSWWGLSLTPWASAYDPSHQTTIPSICPSPLSSSDHAGMRNRWQGGVALTTHAHRAALNSFPTQGSIVLSCD